MTVNSRGPFGEPIIQNPPTRIPDMTAIAAYAALVGNRIRGTSSQRNNFTAVYGFAPFAGLEFFEQDTANEYVWTSDRWAGIKPQAGIVEFQVQQFGSAGGGYEVNTTVNFAAGRFSAPPVVSLGVFTQATQNQHAGVANVTATSFILYVWRTNQTATSVGWTAIPSDS